MTTRLRDAAHWGSWADWLDMIRARLPQLAVDIISGAQRNNVCQIVCFPLKIAPFGSEMGNIGTRYFDSLG